MKHLLRESSLPELRIFDEVAASLSAYAKVETLDYIEHKEMRYPIRSLVMGNPDPEAPCLCLIGGVHGIERIGSHVILSFLRSLAGYIRWSDTYKEIYKKIRLAVIPVINPIGMALKKRGNGNRVDLMRNAPVESDEVKWYQLFAGQNFSSRLHWYRGNEIQKEVQILLDFVRKHCFSSRFSISIDFHSGFGFRDRIWFPYAYTRKPPPNLAEIYRLRKLLREVYPYHVYKFEPQTNQYLIKGDLWDYLYKDHNESSKNGIYLPFTLELGSWQWLRKNPMKLFSSIGIYNPVKIHRYHRVLRRHQLLINFMLEASINHKNWMDDVAIIENDFHNKALKKWYGT